MAEIRNLDIRYVGSAEEGGVMGFLEHIEVDLTPCPFCQSRTPEVRNTHSPCYWVECRDCGAQGPCGEAADENPQTSADARVAHNEALYAAVQGWERRRADA